MRLWLWLLQVGDIIRVGSVGLLVSELNPGLEGYDKQVVSQVRGAEGSTPPPPFLLLDVVAPDAACALCDVSCRSPAC